MARRKWSHEIRESWTERTIREAIERGEFDGVEGEGEPLEVLQEPYEPNWWAKRWMKREGFTDEELRQAIEARRKERGR